MRLRRGRPAEWVIWTLTVAIGISGFGDGLRATTVAWTVPLAAVIAYLALPWLARYRAAAVDLGNRRRAASHRDDSPPSS